MVNVISGLVLEYGELLFVFPRGLVEIWLWNTRCIAGSKEYKLLRSRGVVASAIATIDIMNQDRMSSNVRSESLVKSKNQMEIRHLLSTNFFCRPSEYR